MAIIKAIGRTSKSSAGMRNSIEYIMNPVKTTYKETLEDGTIRETRLIDFNGPLTVGDDLSYFSAHKSFMEQKQVWNKTDGKQYYHNVISFPPNGEVTPYDVMEIAQQFVDKYLSDFQTVIAVHLDKDTLHAHIISNSVSYMDGHKCQIHPQTLKDMKKYIINVCKERGLVIAEKGKHFDGADIEPYEVTTYDKNKWHLLANETKKSYLVDCACAVDNAMHNSASKDEFIDMMLQAGWRVTWTDKRKHITFENDDGKKVRDSNISKTFNMNVSKEDLIYEFERQNSIRQQQDRYTAINRTDTNALIGEVQAVVADSRTKDRAIRSTENKSMVIEKQSITRAREQRLEEQQRLHDEAERERAREREHHSFHPSR